MTPEQLKLGKVLETKIKSKEEVLNKVLPEKKCDSVSLCMSGWSGHITVYLKPEQNQVISELVKNFASKNLEELKKEFENI